VYYFQFYIWETFIPFLRSGARRINWTHAIQAPMATVKQQAVKSLANIKAFMNEMCMPGGPAPPFDGTKLLSCANRLTDWIICRNIWDISTCKWGALHPVCHFRAQIQGALVHIGTYWYILVCFWYVLAHIGTILVCFVMYLFVMYL